MYNDSIQTQTLVQRALSGLEAEGLRGLLDLSLEVLAEAAIEVKERVFGRRIRLVRLCNIKSGLCPEDCAYCAQSARWATSAPQYPLLTPEAILAQAEEARQSGAARFCLVSATRSPSPKLLGRIEEVAPTIKAMGLELCTSLGLLTEKMARRLKEAGVDYYNHNLNTSQGRYPQIATTHRYEDRLQTLAAARKAGLELCSGVILGMGETLEETLEMALALRRLGAKSVPVNFLLPIPKTPLGKEPGPRLPPEEALRRLALFRLALPQVELRASAGREQYFGPHLPLTLQMVNSIFIRGYLTQGGAALEEDLALLQSLGLEVVPG